MSGHQTPPGFWQLLDTELQQEVLRVIEALDRLQSALADRLHRLAQDDREEAVVWRGQLELVAQEVKAVSSSVNALQTMPIPEPYQFVEGFQLSQDERAALHTQMVAFLARIQEMTKGIPEIN